MTVASLTNKSGPYNGNGSTANFAVNTKYTAKSEVVVIVTSSAGVETTKTLDTHYTLTDPGDSGTVSFITSPTDFRPQTGETVTIITVLALTQATDLTTGGNFSANVVEGAFDKLTRLVHQLAEKISRAPKLRQTSTTGEILLTEPSAGAFLRWNSAEDGLENGTTGGPGSGDVVGPGSATDHAITRFDGTSGGILQDSAVTITDAGIMNGAVAVGVNATADTTNRLSVNSAAVLFNHEGAGAQIKVNKNAAGDTASYLFQTGFSGRAEFGTIADNDFTLKTSPDGSAFTTALIVDNATGALRVGVGLRPSANDGAALGVSGTAWSDLFLASGGVINFNAGDVTITHSADALAFAGAASGYSFDDDITQARQGGLWTNRPSYKGTTVTITIASPGVITWTAHGLPAGQGVAFLTTGALPTGITADTTYYVSATGLTTDSFQISATPGGASINTSGGQSGVHSGYIVGVNIARFERVFVGAACVNDGTKIPTGSGADWLETRAQFTTSNAELAVVANSGRGAIVGAVRSIDNDQAGSNGIACSLYNYNDNATEVTASWGLYIESERSASAGFTTCVELAPVELGTPTSIDPYASSFAGVTSALWNAAGGEEAAPNDVPVGIAMIGNNAKFEKGIYFHKDSINGTDGATGTGIAIAMALGHKIDWFSAASTIGASIYASAKGVLNIGSTDLSTEAFNLELGTGRTGNGSCRIDLHSASGTDYETRIVRLSGANGNFQIENTGTGSLQLNASNAAGIIQFLTGGTEGLRIGTDQSVRANSATGGLGYGTGAGGAVTQATNKSTGVTLNNVCGAITMNNASLNAATAVSFTLTNSTIAQRDLVLCHHGSAGTAGAYRVAVKSSGSAGSVIIEVTNTTGGALGEAILLNFAVIKAVNS